MSPVATTEPGSEPFQPTPIAAPLLCTKPSGESKSELDIYVYDISVYDISVYDISVYDDMSVYVCSACCFSALAIQHSFCVCFLFVSVSWGLSLTLK